MITYKDILLYISNNEKWITIKTTCSQVFTDNSNWPFGNEHPLKLGSMWTSTAIYTKNDTLLLITTEILVKAYNTSWVQHSKKESWEIGRIYQTAILEICCTTDTKTGQKRKEESFCPLRNKLNIKLQCHCCKFYLNLKTLMIKATLTKRNKAVQIHLQCIANI